MKNKNFGKLLFPRLLIFFVLAMNLLCALAYIFNPLPYVAPFELEGEAGRVAVIGTGILFVMWQVPYVFALIEPQRNRRSLLEAVLMQTIGLVGESLLLSTIPAVNAALRGTILRFIYFDALGLVLLLAAFAIIIHAQKNTSGEKHAD